MGLIAVLVGGLRVLLGTLGMFLALGMIAFAVVFGGGTVGLSCVFVVLSSFVVFVFGHFRLVRLFAPSRCQIAIFHLVPRIGQRSVAHLRQTLGLRAASR